MVSIDGQPLKPLAHAATASNGVAIGEIALRVGGVTLHEGDSITLDGNEGCIYQGAAKTVREEPAELLARLAQLHAR